MAVEAGVILTVVPSECDSEPHTSNMVHLMSLLMGYVFSATGYVTVNVAMIDKSRVNADPVCTCIYLVFMTEP